MMDLFEWHKSVRKTDPETSVEAAKSAESLASRHHQLILGALRAVGRALAAEEIGDVTTELNHVHVGKRLCELERNGLIIKTEEKHKNRSGRYAFRYRLAP